MIRLPEGEAHHARDVLRLSIGDEVELFDSAGQTARGFVRTAHPGAFAVEINSIIRSEREAIQITIASAVPKGERADWLVEKLSEIGVDRFIPLETERSVVLPKGKAKRERWLRIAIESAKQSRRAGVMQIDELTPLERAIALVSPERTGWYFSTESADAQAVEAAINSRRVLSILLVVGPEGGWTKREQNMMRERNLTPVRLTATILRVETAAVVAAGIVATLGSMLFKSTERSKSS